MLSVKWLSHSTIIRTPEAVDWANGALQERGTQSAAPYRSNRWSPSPSQEKRVPEKVEEEQGQGMAQHGDSVNGHGSPAFLVQQGGEDRVIHLLGPALEALGQQLCLEPVGRGHLRVITLPASSSSTISTVYRSRLRWGDGGTDLVPPLQVAVQGLGCSGHTWCGQSRAVLWRRWRSWSGPCP